MIENQNDITKYTEFNKIYIPQANLNNNYIYKINGDYITIITNNNCYQNYNTTYCDCRMYNYKVNLITDSYSCSTNNNNPTIPFSSLTSDINYSSYIRNIFVEEKSILLIIVIVALLFAKFLTKERSSY